MAIVVKLSELSPPQIEKIQTELKVHEKPNFFGAKNFYQNKNNFKDDVDLTIFHGDYVRIPYNFAVQLLGYNPQINIWKDHYSYPLKFTGQLRDYQQEICVEAGKHLNEYCTTILNVFASAGKTIMATYLATRCDYLRLIIYPGIDLGKQWAKTIKDFTYCLSTNNGPARIWMVGEGKVPTEPVDFVLCPITRIDKIDPKFLSMVGMLIIDEFHLMYTQIRVRELLKISPKYIIGCTATLGVKKEIAHLFCGPKYVFMKSTKPFTVYKFYTGITMDEKLNKSGTLDWPEFLKKQITNPIRNEQIIGLCVTNPQKKICLMGWRKEHALDMAAKLKNMNEKVDIMIGSKREYEDSRILCGTISKIGTGFDEANACADFDGTRINLLIMTGTMKNEVLIEQTAGRCFRAEFPSIIYLVDNNSISHKHWEVAEDWFISRNGTVKEIYSKFAQANLAYLIPLKTRRKKKEEIENGIVKIWDGKRLGGYTKKDKYNKKDTAEIRNVSLEEHGIKTLVSSSEADAIKQMLEDTALMGY